jgi:hypothetical protein
MFRFIETWFERESVEAWTAAGALVAFGDNLQRRGRGGVAAACRGIDGTVGIPTKHAPSMKHDAFFRDADFARVRPSIDAAFNRLEAGLREGRTIYWPSGGIGTGLSRLSETAPHIWAYLEARRVTLLSMAADLDAGEVSALSGP